MHPDFVRSAAIRLALPLLLIGLSARAEASSIWDCLTGKKSQPSGTCNSPGGKCGQAPTAGAMAPGAVPGGAASGTGQPYMVPIGPSRLVPSTPGAASGAPSLSPAGAALPSLSPTTVARPTWPATPVTQNSYPFAVGSTGAVEQSAYYQPLAPYPTTRPSAVAPVQAGAAPCAPGAPCPTCQRPVAVNYAPYTAYHNQAMQVPVTVYRPVTGIDPRTGAAVTVLQPCQVASSQVQRVPSSLSRSYVRTYQPLPLSGPKKQVAAATPAYVALPMIYAVPSAFAVPPTLAAPTVAPAAAWNPTGAVVPAYGTSGVPTGPALPAVPPSAPSHPGVLGTPQVEPADQAPSLKSSDQGTARGISRGGFRPRIPSSSTDDLAGSPLSGEGLRAAGAAPSGTAAGLVPVPSMAPRVTPIPVPATEDSRSLLDRIPALVNPPTEDRRTQTAPPRSTLVLNRSEPRVVQPTSRRETELMLTPARGSLDDSGWRSLGVASE